MTFNEAMKELLAGKRVRNTTWPKGVYLFNKENGDVLIRMTDGSFQHYVLNKYSMTCNWEYYGIKEGTLLKNEDGDSFRVVLNSHGDSDVISLNSWVSLGVVETEDKLEALAHKYHLEIVSEQENQL